MDAVQPVPGVIVRDVVSAALAEDLTPLGDITAPLLPVGAVASGSIGARESGVLAGSACVDETFLQVDPRIEVTWSRVDGDALEVGDVIAQVGGPLGGVLTGERTALNFLCHLSGVATLTARFVAAAAGSRIWDTRKTIPGLRSLEKAAVRAGGGRNHRGNLSEWVMLKDNHLAHVGLTEAVARATDLWPGRMVHVECDSLQQVNEAVAAGVGAILLDNMTPDEVSEAMEIRAGSGSPCLLEASGGITLETVAAYAETGVDLISTGAITMSAPSLDLGLDIE